MCMRLHSSALGHACLMYSGGETSDGLTWVCGSAGGGGAGHDSASREISFQSRSGSQTHAPHKAMSSSIAVLLKKSVGSIAPGRL
jgi:hypothetical protein